MILLATDLDGTFLAGDSFYKQTLYKLLMDRKDTMLIFVTGRGLETVIPLLNDPVIPNPQYIICDVGATIVDASTLEPVQPLQAYIEDKWPGEHKIFNGLKDMPGLKWQEVPQMRRCSFFYNEEADLDQISIIVKSLGCDMLISAGKFLDILPPGVNKGNSLQQLVNLLKVPTDTILVAGDTMNDLSLFNAGYKGVVVGGAEQKLLDSTKHNGHVFQAHASGCGGILQSFGHFPAFSDYLPSEMSRTTEKTE